MQKVVVCGHQAVTQAVLVELLTVPGASDVVVYEPDPQVIDLESLTALASMGQHEFRRGGVKQLADADVVILTDFADPTADDYLEVSLAAMRKIINEAMSESFSGKLLVTNHRDEILTYFAQRFSGLPRQQVLGVGTFGLTRIAKEMTAQALEVPSEVVTAYVIGSTTQMVPIWSRSYVASTPLLSLLTGEHAASDFLPRVQESLQGFVDSDAAITLPALVPPLLAAMSGQKPLIAPLTQLLDVDSDVVAYSRPVLLRADGLVTLSVVNGSEAEEAQLNDFVADFLTTVQTIESQE
ncbi:hypothetical protein [Lacticaseibacillus brantae]|uniref:Malate lactate dehydrogenase n=1 Tax=Lacticaseibacillus brantae DSM 23927 TaxID=1423727 RepID=A0A0R2AZM0_9LACO|nr:hypothetical protein [Lacticaseibacillus brantae]KRM72544.1 malate lactate dehydrogenase [Lacticaseibacillus brantae DSM 23927]